MCTSPATSPRPDNTGDETVPDEVDPTGGGSSDELDPDEYEPL